MIHQVVADMDSISQSVQASAQVIRTLDKESEQIDNIANMSQGNTQNINQTASTTDELAQVAGQLADSVARFRL